MKSFLFVGLIVVFFSSAGWSQSLKDTTNVPGSAGLQDSSCAGPLRPRWATYIVETFPSPAHIGQILTVQYYNHNPDNISFDLVDILDRPVRSFMQNAPSPQGLHSFAFNTSFLPTGTYFVRLTNYNADGTVNQVQNSRFVILH